MSIQIYQIQISLKNITPKIWRRILVPADLPMADLHKIIQTTMGWENGHLHQFIKDRKLYSVKNPDDDMWEDSVNFEYKNMVVSDFLKKEKDKIDYEYDFGDGWLHEVLLEKILPVNTLVKYPIVTGGKRTCPPEDCGGPWGYANLLEIISQPGHGEYDDMLEWLGGYFDPEDFNLEEVNQRLHQKNFGCF
jgi:hypothetical protein